MARMKMGDLLVRAGLITESDLRVALAQQKQHGGRLGEHLVRVNLLSEETLARALAQQLSLPFNDLSTAPPPSVTHLLPEKFAHRLQALPVAFEPRTATLSVAFSDPLDEDAIAEVAKVTGRAVAPQVAPGLTLRRAIEHAYFGVEVRDEGTGEFQLMDIHGRGKVVKVDDDHALPELGTSELMPVGDDEPAEAPGASATGGQSAVKPRMRISPTPPPGSTGAHAPVGGPRPTPSASKPAPKPAPAVRPAAGKTGDGEEALAMVWALADLLIEQGVISRADLMRKLRKG